MFTTSAYGFGGKQVVINSFRVQAFVPCEVDNSFLRRRFDIVAVA